MKAAARRALRSALACLAAYVVVAGAGLEQAQAAPHGQFNRPGEDWKVTETRYFRFYFTDQTPRTLSRLLEIADATFERLNAFYGADLGGQKIRVNVVGYTSFSNGFAEFARNRITIYATPANFHYRSRVPWLDNVFTHELSHILSLNRASRWSPKVPLVLGTGVARTPQAQALVRLPVFGSNTPHWFVEGVAQFDTRELERDDFDENRRAFERAGVEDGLFYSLAKLGFYGDERWYNTGFAFLAYLERRFGRGTVHRLFQAAGDTYHPVFESLFENVLRVPLSKLEEDFRAEVQRNLQRHRARVHGGRFDGVEVLPEGETIRYTARSPNEREDLRDVYALRPLRVLGDRLIFRQGDAIKSARFSETTHTLSDTQVLTTGGAFAPHTANTYFVLRQEGHTPGLPSIYRPGFESPSLFLVDDEGSERRLVKETRWADFDVSPVRKELAAVYNDGDGSLILALYPLADFGTDRVRVETKKVRFPLRQQAFDEVRSPRYSPDGTRLYFSRQVGRDHDIYALDFRSGELLPVVREAAFELYPEPTADGVYFVSARDGAPSVYFKPNGAAALERVSEAVTAHHYPVRAPHGVFASRVSGTGFRPVYIRDDARSQERVTELTEKSLDEPAAQRFRASKPKDNPRPSRNYAPFTRDWVTPSFVPLLDLVYDQPGGGASAGLLTRAGLEIYAEDTLRTHALWFRGFLGNESSFFFSYRNDMTFLTLEARAGYAQGRGLYQYDRADGQSFEHLTDYRWGFAAGLASLPLDLFYRVGVVAETLRDLGGSVGAQTRSFDFREPRYARDQIAATFSYSGMDRSDPTFRERAVNKRGYRETDLSVAYAVEEVSPELERFDASLPVGRRPYYRVDLAHSEYLALPKLANGAFDHTLQLDVRLGYIDKDILFLPFYGGGRLFSQTTPQLNASVGFAGYSPFSLAGETLISLAASYRFPLLRRLSGALGPMYVEDLYAQVFTSWGNIWAFDEDGTRQIPLRDRAPNGRHVLGDVGVDLRLSTFFQNINTNAGTTLRVVYRLLPFSACPGADAALEPSCLGINGSAGFMYYLLFGSGF